MLRRILVSLIPLLLSVDVILGEVVVTQRGASEVLIPAAGSLPGGNNTFFRSDIRITNLRSDPQLIAIFWLPQAQSGTGIPPLILTLPGSGRLSSEDFVREVLRRDGLGAILIRGLRPDGNFDLEARLDATTRIWSPGPDGRGTVSQSLPAVPSRQLASFQLAILGQRRDERFRTNAGIVNLDTATRQTFRIIVSGDHPTLLPEATEVTVEPFSMMQVSLPGFEQPNLRIDVQVLPQPGGGFGTLWTAYGASVDNVTGDSWSSLGFDVSPLAP